MKPTLKQTNANVRKQVWKDLQMECQEIMREVGVAIEAPIWIETDRNLKFQLLMILFPRVRD